MISQQKKNIFVIAFSGLTLTLLFSAAILVNPTKGNHHAEAINRDANSLPQTPSMMRDVENISQGQFKRPHIPPYRTSADGRVGIAPDFNRLYLLVPEAITEPVRLSPPGVEILGPNFKSPFGLNSKFMGPLPSQIPPGFTAASSFHTICDGTSQFPENDPLSNQNPSKCSDNANDDCYKLTVISGWIYQDADTKAKYVQLWGAPITVDVGHPKTLQASIKNVTYGTPVTGPQFPFVQFFEPGTSGDGRLLVGRTDQSTLTWNGKKEVIDIVYFVSPMSATPCDVSQWTNWAPISHAPFDPNMVGRYGIADYPFRDSEGNFIPDGEDIGGSYPWIDSKGNNLLFTALPGSLYYVQPGTTAPVLTRYPDAPLPTCLPGDPNCVDPSVSTDIGNYEGVVTHKGLSVIGRWTHGKQILLDNNLNNIDYGMKVEDDFHRLLTLYTDPGSGNPVQVPVGTGREAEVIPDAPPDYVQNTTLDSSFENLFTFLPNMVPLTFRDVVWLVSMGKGATEEVAFDDYINPNTLIISEMSGSQSWTSTQKNGVYTNLLYYHDGFGYVGPAVGTGFNQPIHIQNSATALPGFLAIPPYGLLTGNARLEPIALGGIRGKGVWLDGEAGINYAIPAQPQSVSSLPWYIGLFIDPRFSDDGIERTLLTFPDGSQINTVGLKSILFRNSSGTLDQEIDFAPALPANAWSYIGVQVLPGNKSAVFYLNGFRYKSWVSTGDSLFVLNPGNLAIGNPSGGNGNAFVGWVDELKVTAEQVDSETLCNHARGSLAGWTSSYSGSWSTLMQTYPEASLENAALSASLKTNIYSGYACFVDYSTEVGAYAAEIPAGMVGLRQLLHFPEGPLRFDAPRVNSSQNQFCLSCHISANPQPYLTPPSLSIQALVPSSQLVPPEPGLLFQNDPRRQPIPPLRLMYGHMEDSFLLNNPNHCKLGTAPAGASYLDCWDFPAKPKKK